MSDVRGRSFHPWYLVGLFACLGVISLVDRLALSLLIQPMKADLGISDTQAGLLIGPAFAIIYTLSAFPVAWALDRHNRKWIAVAGVTLWSASTTASAFAPDFQSLFLLRMGVGIGEAVLNPVIVSLVGDLFTRDRRPTPISVFMTAQTLGGSASFLLVAVLLDLWASRTFGVPSLMEGMTAWRATLLIVGLPGLVVAALLAFTMREPERGLLDGVEADQPVRRNAFASRAAAARFYLPFLLGINLVGMMQIISVSWAPTFLIRAHGAAVSHAGYLFGYAMLVACAGTLAWPIIAERLARRGRRDSVFLLLLLLVPAAALSMVGVVMAPSLAIGIIFVALFHIATNGIVAMPSVVISAIGSPGFRARLVALHLFIQALLAYTMGPVLVPYLSDTFFGHRLGAGILAVGCIAFPLAYLFTLVALRPYRRAVAA